MMLGIRGWPLGPTGMTGCPLLDGNMPKNPFGPKTGTNGAVVGGAVVGAVVAGVVVGDRVDDGLLVDEDDGDDSDPLDGCCCCCCCGVVITTWARAVGLD